ncbi:MAG: phospholipase [Solirubrobacteraceae bacterium]|jgi:phospholipase C|nr:phospholipase [Solirubrobacterales bacterium]MEA2215853.1 phospholipase [Solirubrobacteraceae bacterium]
MDSGLTRRQVLQAGIAAGAVALSSDPLVQLASAAATPPPGKLSDIEHVIILIQENRSFDHYFGTYSGVEGFGSPGAKAVYEQEGYPAEGFENKLLPFHLETNNVAQCFPDITHSWQPQHRSWNNGAMDEFVRTHLEKDGSQAGPATMGYHEKADIPFYHALANAFTLCDHYHCSVLGPTDPNRLYSMTGTIDPGGANGGPLLETLEKGDPRASGKFTWETMPEALTTAGISWKVYDGPTLGFEDNPLEYFKNFKTDPALASKAFANSYPKSFKHDLNHGELPQVSWINTSAAETEHPGNSSAKIGEAVVADLLKRVMGHKSTWEKTAILITWDENGGFFDHVAPPAPPLETAGEYLTAPDITNNSGGVKGPIGLGFRVPMLVVSPFSRGGLVSSQVYDHTSMLRFLETRFGVEVPNLSAWRRETTNDLTGAFNFAAPPIFKKPKGLPKVEFVGGEGGEGGCTAKAPVTVPPNSQPVQEPGTRGTPSGI